MLIWLNIWRILDAGDRFELPMHLAYETGVVATLPAQLFIYCKTHYQSRGFEPLSFVVYHDFYGQASNVFYDSA